MLDMQLVLRELLSLLVILLTAAIIYCIAGIFAPRGKHTELARRPFTGGVTLPHILHRYFTDMMVFVTVFLLSESIALLLFLEARDPLTAVTLLLGSMGVFLPAIASHSR